MSLTRLSSPLRALFTRARRLKRDESGAVAMEFGFVAFPFFLLLFSIIEVAMAFFANQILDNAVSDAARMIRTGQAQAQNFSETEFKAQICGKLMGLFDCAGGKMYIDVKTYDSFGDVAIPSPINDDGEVEENFGYDDGGPETIIVTRVYYEWPLFTNFIGTGLGNLANGNRLLAAVSTFRNEPFPE
ncbi:MAG: TadE/TadG family type IV pilus assembly protein [Pseudomonadota bacterium]